MKLGSRSRKARSNLPPGAVVARGEGRCRPLPLAAFILLLLSSCGATEAPIAHRLVDSFQPDMVEGSPTKVKAATLPIVWNFSEPLPQPSPKKATANLGWKPGVGVSGLRIREGRLQGRSTTDFPIIYARRSERLDDRDLLAEVEVRLRVNKGANLSLQFSGPEDVNFGDVLAGAKGLSQPWGLTTPIVAGESFQTYTLRPRGSVSLSGIHHILFRPTDAQGAEFEIESIRLLSQRERLARIPSGVGWQGLDEIFRETVVARSPETIRLPLTLPDDPWLDLHLGTPEDGAVTFRVSLSSAADDEIVLLERTLTTAHRWETAHVDLAAYGGKEVTLWFSLPDAEDGTLGFWGSPVVRARGEPPMRAGEFSGALARAPAPQGVILMVVDTLRKDHLDSYGYKRPTAPTLSRLAAEGALFQDVVSQATWTKVSVASIMTSLYPASHGVAEVTDRLPAAANTLAEAYRAAGYATLSYSSVAFTGKLTNLHQGFEELHELGSTQLERRTKTARVYADRLCAWLEEHRDAPFFVFFHVFDPHDPYEPRQPYNSKWADPGKKEDHERDADKLRKVIPDPFMRRRAMGTRRQFETADIDTEEYLSYDRDWYDGSIRAMDAELARVLERLKTLGLAEKTMIAFIADHGEEFLDHGRMFHGQTLYGELTNVPLVLFWPGVVPNGVVIDETVRSIDLMPTLLEISGRPLPEGLQGQSLMPLMRAARELRNADLTESTLASLAGDLGWQKSPVVSERATTQQSGGPRPREDEAVSIVLDGWKLIHNTKSSSGKPEFELFQHTKDPLDLTNVADEHPDVVEKLLAELQTWRDLTQAGKLPPADSTEGLSDDELRRLRSLGYIQ